MSRLKFKNCEAAVEFNDLEEVKKMVAADFDLSKYCMTKASENGNLSLLEFLYNNGCPFDNLSFRAAAKNGHVNCLKFLVEHGCENNVLSFDEVITNGHLDCLKYMVEIGMNIENWMVELSFKRGQYKIFQYLLEKGLEFYIQNYQISFDNYMFSRSRMDCLKLTYLAAENKAEWWLPCFDKWFNGFDLDDKVWRETFGYTISVCPKLEARINAKKKLICRQTKICISALSQVPRNITQFVIATFF